MKAVLIATGSVPVDNLGHEDELAELRDLVCRPWIEHVVEQLAARGIRQFWVLLCRNPERFRRVLGDGERWGVTINLQTVRDPDRPYARIRTLAEAAGEASLLVGHADRLPDFAGIGTFEELENPGALLFSVDAAAEGESAGGDAHGSGYAIVDSDCLSALPVDGSDEQIVRVLNARVAAGTAANRPVPRILDARDARGLLEANVAALRKEYRGLLMKNNEVQEGVWLSRNVVLHPTARVTPPVFIAEECRIEEQVCLGPGAIIGTRCVIDRKATVERSIVRRKSYVGENLEVCDAIVDRNRLVNTRIGAAVSISENFLLGSLRKTMQANPCRRLASKIAGLVLLVLSLPLQLAAVVWAFARAPRHPFRRVRFVNLPAGSDPGDWQTSSLLLFRPPAADASIQPILGTSTLRDFFLVFLPGLWSVVFGQMHVVGLPPRGADSIRSLPEDWENLYRRCKPGLITENLVIHHASSDPDDNYAAETFYAATSSWRHDLVLFATYCKEVLCSAFKKR